MKVLICITSKEWARFASARYYAVNCWLSVETRIVQIIEIHREYPNFILARGVNSLPGLLARDKADFSFISRLPCMCLRIMLIRNEMTSSGGSSGSFPDTRNGFWFIKIWLNWSTDIQLSPNKDPKDPLNIHPLKKFHFAWQHVYWSSFRLSDSVHMIPHLCPTWTLHTQNKLWTHFFVTCS